MIKEIKRLMWKTYVKVECGYGFEPTYLYRINQQKAHGYVCSYCGNHTKWTRKFHIKKFPLFWGIACEHCHNFFYH